MKTFSKFLVEANSYSCNKSDEGTDCPSHGLCQCPGFKKFKTPEEIAKKHRLEVEFINNQLKTGIKIEREHTKDKEKAMEIALQHLEEIPDYYTRLKKMESSAKKEHKKFKDVKIDEERKSGDYSLHDWFSKSKSSNGKPGWVQLGGPFSGKPCARQPGQKSTPKCGSSKMKKNLSSEEEQKAFERKNRKDPNQPKKKNAAKPTNVATEETIIEKKDACYHKVKSRYKVWPSAYASGALVKCRKKGAKNWGTKSESFSEEYIRIQSNGKIYGIMSIWRGKSIYTQIFFPQPTKPTKEQVSFEMNKIYPGARVISYYETIRDQNKPLLFVGDSK